MDRAAAIVLATIFSFIPWLTSQSQTDRFLLFGEGLVGNSVESETDFDNMNLDSSANYLRLNMGVQNIRWRDQIFTAAMIRGKLREAYSHNNLRVMVHDPAGWSSGLYMTNVQGGERRLYHPECEWQFDRTDCRGLRERDADGKTAVLAPASLNIVHAQTTLGHSAGYLLV